MPNHVRNWIDLEAKQNWAELLFDEREREGEIDFKKIVPMPPHQPDLSKPEPFFAEGSLPMDIEASFGSDRTWYGWSVKNWGTKWNAYDQLPADSYWVSQTGWRTFQTAWSMPTGIARVLVKRFPSLTWLWADEDRGRNYGVVRNGCVYIEPFGKYTVHAQFFAHIVRDGDPDQFDELLAMLGQEQAPVPAVEPVAPEVAFS